MGEHLVFYDAECPLCNKAVRYILEIDTHKRFFFAPLNGRTAGEILVGPNERYKRADTIVLVEDYQSTSRQFWIRSRAILRVYWLVGDGWGIVGWLSFLPGWVGDLFYRWVAYHRHKFKFKGNPDLGHKDRFLP